MKPDLLNWPRWKVYASLACLPLILGFEAGPKWYAHYYDQWGDIYMLLTLLAFGIGVVSIRLAFCVRYLDQQNDKLVKQTALDKERIWKLEEAIEELKNNNLR